MGLDYVYRYFAPGFSHGINQMLNFAALPLGVEGGKPPPGNHALDQVARELLTSVSSSSALVRRVSELITYQAG